RRVHCVSIRLVLERNSPADDEDEKDRGDQSRDEPGCAAGKGRVARATQRGYRQQTSRGAESRAGSRSENERGVDGIHGGSSNQEQSAGDVGRNDEPLRFGSRDAGAAELAGDEKDRADISGGARDSESDAPDDRWLEAANHRRPIADAEN